MTRIFISYRRSDSATIAGRIYDRLVDTFGEDNVFKDTYSINPGEDFRGKIRETVAQCDVVLVIIGDTWLTVTDQTGQRRLDNVGDWVRIEVETGLQRDGALVIPVLVENAPMPAASDLPDNLRELAYKNAANVRDDPDFRDDIRKLIAVIQKVGVKPQQERKFQNRFLEAAMPACTQPSAETEVRIKISLPDSPGLRGELPDVLPSGDVIQKGDVRSTSFQMAFPVQETTGNLTSSTVCVRAITDDFTVRVRSSRSTVCDPNDAEVVVQPEYDSRTLVFDLLPKPGLSKLGLSRVRIELYSEGQLLAETSVATRLVNNLSDDPNCTFWWLSSSLLARQPLPPPAAPAPQAPVVDLPAVEYERAPTEVGSAGRKRDFDTPQPMSPRPQDMPLPAPASPRPARRSNSVRAAAGATVVLLGLVFAFLALFPEQTRTDWFRSLGLVPAVTNTEIASISSSTPDSTRTALPSNTPVLATSTATSTLSTSATLPPTPITTSGLTIGSQASVRSSNETGSYLNIHVGVTRNDRVIQQVPSGTTVTIVAGPLASQGRIWWKVRTPDGVEGWAIEASATRQTLLPIERTATLLLIMSPDSLTLVVTSGQAVNLSGLEFLVSDGQGGTHTVTLDEGFPHLQLTQGEVEAGTCFVAVETGATPPLPSICSDPQKVFRRDVPRTDVFWYDFMANRQRDVAVLRDGKLVTLCAAAATECAINYSQ